MYDHPLAGLHQIERQRRQRGGVRGVDDRVKRQRRQLRGGPDAVEPERAREARATARARPSRAPRRRRLARTRPPAVPIVPGPSTSTRSPGVQVGAPHRAQRVPAGLDHRAGGVVDARRGARPARRPARRAARPARPACRRGCRPRCGPRTRAGDRTGSDGSARSPSIVSPATRRPSHAASTPLPTARDHAAPLVPEPHRVGGVAVVQVRHLAREELHVGPAHADASDVDDDLAGPAERRLDLLHRALARRR